MRLQHTHPFRFAIPAALLVAGMLPAQTPTPTPCPTATPCPWPTPTPAPSPSPTPKPVSGVDTERAFQSQYTFTGRKNPVQPRAEAPPRRARTPFLYPNANSSTLVNSGPNQYDALLSQTIYQDNMWAPGEQAADFASRIITMSGANIASLTHLFSGLGKTRANNTRLDMDNIKYTVGTWSQGMALRGGTAYDMFEIVGAEGLASVAFANGLSAEDNSPDPLMKQIYVSVLQGAEGGAFVGARIAPEDAAGRLATDVDFRQQSYIEDTLTWNPVPAIVLFQYGATGTAWLDGAQTDVPIDPFYSSGMSEPTQAGFINMSAAVRAVNIAAVEKSFVNARQVFGFWTQLVLEEIFQRPPDVTPCPNGRTNSSIREYYGLAVEAPYIAPGTCADIVQTGVGIYVDEPAVNTGGGSPLQDARLAAPDLAGRVQSAENGASIVARGNVVIGDGHAQGATGFDTDVLRVRDVVHLSPRTGPPQFTDDVPASDRAGLMYFDAGRGCLRVSVPAKFDGAEGSVVWVDVKLDTDSIDPARDVVGGGGAGQAARSREDVTRAIAAARVDGATGPHVAPAIRAVVEPAGLASRGSGPTPVLLHVRGFEGKAPRLYWRLANIGREGGGVSGWRAISTLDVLPPERISESELAFTAVMDFTEAFAGIDTDKTHPSVEVLALHPETGQSAGTSFGLDVSGWRS